jgi:hypothetical protein
MNRRKLNDGNTAAIDQAPTQACQSCLAQSQCCPKSQSGRYANRSLYKERPDTIAQWLDTDEGRSWKTARWVMCDGAFARLNHLLHWAGAVCGTGRARRRNYCGDSSCTI